MTEIAISGSKLPVITLLCLLQKPIKLMACMHVGRGNSDTHDVLHV